MMRSAAAGLATLAMLISCSASPPAPVDVILITLDTTRMDHLGVYGYGRNTSPRIDAFAQGASVYRRAWSTASWTLPAHASLLTGLHPTSHGAHFDAGGSATLGEVVRGPAQSAAQQAVVNRLGPEVETLAELLSASGFATAAFAGGPWLAPEFGLLQGYEHVDASARGLGGKRAGPLTDAAIRWLDRQDPEQPVHLLINYFDPHWPYDPPPGFDELPGSEIPVEIDSGSVNRGEPMPPQQRVAVVARYDGEIQYMDQQLGRLLDALDSRGRLDRALVIVTADHGESFGEHGLMEHGRWLYEEVLRVPLIVRFPGGRDGGLWREAPVSGVDLLPLIAAETGIALPAGVEGLAPGSRDAVLAESFRDALAIRSWGSRFDRDLAALIRWPWKLILQDNGSGELYRLDEDPAELNDRFGNDDEVAALRSDLARARSALQAPPAHRAEPDPTTLEQLRALGYVE